MSEHVVTQSGCPSARARPARIELLIDAITSRLLALRSVRHDPNLDIKKSDTV